MRHYSYKNLSRTVLVLLVGLWINQAIAKPPKDSTRYIHQVSLLVDNDVFTSLFRDQYYSSGIFGIYRWLASQNDNSKQIRSLTLVQRMFTPRLVSWSKMEQLDRPYAGHLSIIYSQEYLRDKSAWQHRLELGWMGPGSLTGAIQENWHETFGMPLPQGWKYQIQDCPITNYYGSYNRSLYRTTNLEMMSESNLAVGTAFNYARQELMVRAGKFKPFDQGVQYQGQLGRKKSITKSEVADEVVVFYVPGVEYNFYNSTIEGNIFGPEPPHTETALRWIIQHRFGLLFSWPAFDMTINYYRRTKETTESLPHQYAGVQLSTRF